MSDKFSISINKDPAIYGYNVGIVLEIDGLELEKEPGSFAKMLNKEFKKIIIEIEAQMQERIEFIEGKYHRIFLPKFYLCKKCGQMISESARKEHEKRWFDYSVCPQPGGIIHVRREDERSQKQDKALPQSTREVGPGRTDPKDG
ncbi:MAG TPA: hypothetical protein ENI27_00480 [bacterium]|nr:hypothetical protein [bacterium]